MTAIETAAAVLAWAEQLGGSPNPPAGGLEYASRLTSPGADLLEQLRHVLVDTAARLGAGVPPFGDDGPVGLGALLLAAAIGGRKDAEVAGRLIAATPPLPMARSAGPGVLDDMATAARGWADATARHGVVAAFAASGKPRGPLSPVGGDLVEGLLGASPLTAVLLRPPLELVRALDLTAHISTALRLIARPRGRLVLISSLAKPATDAWVLTWRGLLLAELLAEHLDLVLAVYVAARLRHGDEWDSMLALAGHAPSRSRGSAVLGFWAPLAAIDKQDPALLRSQLFLDGKHRQAIDLAERYAMTTIS